MTRQSVKSETPFHLTGYHVFAIMAAFFGVIIAVNFTMATMASRTWTGLVVKNSYVASQGYNNELTEAATQKQRGWVSSLSYSDKTLKFRLEDRNKKTMIPDRLELRIGRPSFEQEDQILELNADRNGNYSIVLNLKPGEWVTQFIGTIGGLPYRRDARLLIKSDGTGTVR